MAFKGGTSLSKCYGLIDRFSEDVDVTIDYREFMPDLDLSKESKNSLKKKRDKLKVLLAKHVAEIVVPKLIKSFTAEFGNDSLKYELKDDERLFIYYPSVFESSDDSYVAGSVLIEFGGTNKTEPSEERLVKPYFIFDGLSFPTAKVSVFSPLRTFWEKVTLIHVECHRGRLEEAPDRLSRHWYDLAKLSQSWVKSDALSDQQLLNDVLLVKKSFFNASYANYDKCESKNFCLVPNDEEIKKLKLDYAKMIESDMFLNEPVDFDSLIGELSRLQVLVNEG